MEKLIDCQWFCALFCYSCLEQGGCLVMTQLSSKFVPHEELSTENALDSLLWDLFLGHATVPCLGVPADSLF